MPFKLPPPPKSRGVWGLVVTIAFVIWTGYLMSTYASKKPETTAVPTANGPSFMEIDLRGPKYDEGRYLGYQKGLEAHAKNFTKPADNVLAFQASEEAKTKTSDKSESDDFAAGYQSGFSQAIGEKKSEKKSPQERR